jgi:hypothetical protein
MKQADPTFVLKKLTYRLSKADYQRRWGNSYRRPGFGTRVLAFLLKLIPKVGPLKDLSLRVPSADAQKHFLSGMDSVVDRYNHSLDTLQAQPADRPSLKLASLDLDTGKPTGPAEYALADQTYARYLALLVKPRPPAPPATPSTPWVAPEPSGPEAAGTQPQGPQQKGTQPPTSKAPAAPQPAPATPAQPDRSQPNAQLSEQKPSLQPIDPVIRADVERYFAHSAPGELLLKKKQWKDLPKNLQTFRQLPTAPSATRAALTPQP